MLSSKLATPRRLEAPQSGVPQSHWKIVKYLEQEREEGPLGGPGSWRVEHCMESQGQPLRVWVGGRRGLLSSPPALAQRTTSPPSLCASLTEAHTDPPPHYVHSRGQAEGSSGNKL